jgi:cell division transport system permease protein
MFILPLMAILLGVEFYLVFDRTTDSYEQGLKDGYSMLVVTENPVTLEKLQSLNAHISSSEKIKREAIVKEIAKGVSESSSKEILTSLPHFYTVRLDAYIGTSELEEIKEDLEADQEIKSVETFGSSYSSSYRLFSFIKLSLKIFIGFMAVVSLLLIIKQMEIWRFTHLQRMQVMEIFGAPLMLRSGILFRVAIIDALLATLFTSIIFIYIKLVWAGNSGIDIMMQNQDELFRILDIGMLLFVALFIVIMAVATVVLTSKGVEE